MEGLKKSATTLVAYEADFACWTQWCLDRNIPPMPPAPADICAFLEWCAAQGKAASTIGRRVAAIAFYCKQQDMNPLPTDSQSVRIIKASIRQSINRDTVKKTPATADIILAMMAQCDRGLIGYRDRALIAVGMGCALRRSELVALTMDDIEPVKAGLLITIRRSKHDQQGSGQFVMLPHGHLIRPVEALNRWLGAANITKGALFRQVKLGSSKPEEGALKGNAVSRIIKKLADRAGLDSAEFSGHSLRSGFCTSAAESGASVWKMLEQSRHKSLNSLEGYVRSKRSLGEHAGDDFL